MAGHRGPASIILAGWGSHRPRRQTGSALTWGPMTLVVAPAEHPLPVGLGSRRAARGGEPIRIHATPLTEALHVPLHLERSCCAVRHGPPLVANARAPVTGRSQELKVSAALPVRDAAVREGAARAPRQHHPRVADGGPIHARLALGNPAVTALRMPRSDAEPTFFEEPPASDAHWRPLLLEMSLDWIRVAPAPLQPLVPARLDNVG